MNRNRYNLERVSLTELYDVVAAASCQDPSRLKPATDRLKQLTELGGTYDALQEMAAQRSLPSGMRQLSIIQFKNVAMHHWKSRKFLSDEERARIRARSLVFIDEEDSVIASCNELIIAKIARHDFPTNWPSLIDEIMGCIDASFQIHCKLTEPNNHATLRLRRSLRILIAILKEFSSMKMLNGIRTMGNIVAQIHSKLSEFYAILSSKCSTLDPSSIASSRSADDILLADLVYEGIAVMATWIWSQSDKMGRDVDKLLPWFHEVFQGSVFQAKVLIELRTNLVIACSSHSAIDPVARCSLHRLTRHIHLFGQFFRDIQLEGVSRFVTLPMCNELVFFYWGCVVHAANGPEGLMTDSEDGVYPIDFLVQAIVLFKENLAHWTPSRNDGTPNSTTLSQEFVENAVRILVTRLIPLRPSDLKRWMEEPEEWVNIEEREDEQWRFDLRPCSERVLMTLARQYQSLVTPLLQTTFNEIVAQPTVDLSGIIQKEALYCAVGRCAWYLKDSIPFEGWLAHTLAVEVHETNANYPIIKRRIAWLIGKWITDMCTSANNPAVWGVLVHLLRDHGPGTDAVVRLTASAVVKTCVDSIDFDIDTFAPYLALVVTELVQMLGEADTIDGKRRIIGSLDAVIQRAGRKILPQAEAITKPLPQLWVSADTEWTFKASILTTVTYLVAATQEQSTQLGGIVVPLIRESLSSRPHSHTLEPQQGTESSQSQSILFLDTEGLSLWLTALRNSSSLRTSNNGPGLIDLFPLCLSLLSTNLDLLGRITDVVTSYFILDASQIAQVYGLDVFKAFLAALNSKPCAVNVKDVIISVNLLIQLTSSASWGEALHVSGLFAHMLNTLIEDEEATFVLTEYVYVLARIAMSDPRLFLQLISATAASQNKAEAFLFEGLLDKWWCSFDSMSEPRHRKLAAMGIAALVSTGRPEVLQRLPNEIFNLWGDVFAEIKEVQNNVVDEMDTNPGSPRNLKCYWEQDEPPLTYFRGTEGTLEYDRRKMIYENDPIRTTLLTEYIGLRLREAEIACGGTEIFQNVYLAQADPLVLKQIQDELVRR